MMTLYVPDVDDYKTKGEWNKQFNGRIFEGKMIRVLFNGLEFVCSTGSREASLYKIPNEIDYLIISTNLSSETTFPKFSWLI